MSKNPDLATAIVQFFKHSKVGHHENDSVLLAYQEQKIHSLHQIAHQFQLYDTNGDGSGTKCPILEGINCYLEIAIIYCNNCSSQYESDTIAMDQIKWTEE